MHCDQGLIRISLKKDHGSSLIDGHVTETMQQFALFQVISIAVQQVYTLLLKNQCLQNSSQSINNACTPQWKNKTVFISNQNTFIRSNDDGITFYDRLNMNARITLYVRGSINTTVTSMLPYYHPTDQKITVKPSKICIVHCKMTQYNDTTITL